MELFLNGTHLSDWPEVTHAVLVDLAIELELDQTVFDVVVAGLLDTDHSALGFGREKDAVLVKQVVFEDVAENVSSGQHGSGLDFVAGLEFPQLVLVQSGHVDALGDEDRLAHLRDHLKRSLNPVENLLHYARP